MKNGWVHFVQIIKENLNETDRVMIQQMIEARLGDKKGETVKYAPNMVEERREHAPGTAKKEQPLQRDIEACFEDAKLDENKRKHIFTQKAPPPALREQGSTPAWTDITVENEEQEREVKEHTSQD